MYCVMYVVDVGRCEVGCVMICVRCVGLGIYMVCIYWVDVYVLCVMLSARCMLVCVYDMGLC